VSCYADSQVIRHYHAPLTVELNQLVLAEGWDMGLLTPDQIPQLILNQGRLCDFLANLLILSDRGFKESMMIFEAICLA